MRTVVLLPKLHAGAELALNKLLRQPNHGMIGIVRSDISPLRARYWNYLRYGVARVGIVYGALIALTAYLPLVALAIASVIFFHRRRKWRTMNELITKHQLQVLDTEDVNSPSSLSTIAAWQPDILVSLSFDQILRPEVIALAKVAALNVHPGLLPGYKGLWPVFWNLLRKEKYAGVTIHRMTEKIDEGEILAMQRFRIRSDDTKVSLLLHCARAGSRALISTLKKIKAGIPPKPMVAGGQSAYYSFPRRENFKAFFASGRRLFSFHSLIRELRRDY